MRELRVVGLGEETSTVVLEDPIRHERFVVPSDERLRAAARGDVRRLGQMEIATTSPLRPRDIQARIRAGESVADVAAGAGVPAAHVERFAYPVLLERSRVAEMAGRGHPLGEGGAPDPRSLLEILTVTFAGRGQDLGDGSWDAWKGEDGAWIVSLAWRTGHSDHLAHWTFTPGSSGGAVAPRDEPARELLGLEPASGPRRADGSAARPAAPDEAPAAPEEDEELGQGALAVGGGTARPRSGGARSGGAPRGGRGAHTVPDPRTPDQHASGDRAGAARDSDRPAGAEKRPDKRPTEPRRTEARAPERRARDTGRATAPRHRGEATRPEPTRPESSRSESSRSESSRSESSRSESARPDPGRDDGGGDDPDRARTKGRGRNHPIVPSWEDVLLGVRSPRS
ncbi:septation protein SepH [Actinomycetospora sp. TBRC 11914]|uniref:septation protein SepH n=1 Tax=Actinomycetospora sp. TBRC 11914 TaxID=2729387 RepID=UPI00145F4C46|nr:septation protein SepH [Actinomycetospora sp. TBRC 11914]NMO92469.1 DUF3071 domain-containing protein [Actinomycetospora sp. TBRC 11914]